jgi:hypothetical protein
MQHHRDAVHLYLTFSQPLVYLRYQMPSPVKPMVPQAVGPGFAVRSLVESGSTLYSTANGKYLFARLG